MSLNDIELPAIVIQNLYHRSLYDAGKQSADKEPAATQKIESLGNNAKRICIVVQDEETIFLQEDMLKFLIGILTACSLSMADIALVNQARYPGITYQAITENFEAEKIFLFGLNPQSIELPLAFPQYQVQSFNNQVYLAAAPLAELQRNKAEKLKLWNCLKTIFSI